MPFEDIKGQDSAINILRSSIKEQRILSGYLFVGPEGTGRLKTALNFAKAINCLEKNESPCERCSSCIKIESNVHPDVIIVETKGASSSIGIDQIRELISKANLKPYEGNKKVFIVNGASAMNQEASNAFLKTLEEAPDNTVFILVSKSKELLLPTIVSRLSMVRFFPVSSEILEKILIHEKNLSKEEAVILSKFSSGRIGEALRMKEAGTIEIKNRIIDSFLYSEEDVIDTYSDRTELKRDVEFLLSFFRDIFMYKTLGDMDKVFNSDRGEDIKAIAELTSKEDINDTVSAILELISYVDYNVNPKTLIHVLKNKLRRYNAGTCASKAS